MMHIMWDEIIPKNYGIVSSPPQLTLFSSRKIRNKDNKLERNYKMPVLKPSRYYTPEYIFGPAPVGWYRAQLKEILPVTTKKGKPAYRLRWEANNGPAIYTVFKTFSFNNGLLSKMTWGWQHTLLRNFPKFENGYPDLSLLLDLYADIHVGYSDNGYLGIQKVQPPNTNSELARQLQEARRGTVSEDETC